MPNKCRPPWLGDKENRTKLRYNRLILPLGIREHKLSISKFKENRFAPSGHHQHA